MGDASETLGVPVAADAAGGSRSGIDLEALGALLEAERRRKLLSQRAALAQVRKRMGQVVAMSTLQSWEGGERLPEGAELVGYLCGLGASPALGAADGVARSVEVSASWAVSCLSGRSLHRLSELVKESPLAVAARVSPAQALAPDRPTRAHEANT